MAQQIMLKGLKKGRWCKEFARWSPHHVGAGAMERLLHFVSEFEGSSDCSLTENDGWYWAHSSTEFCGSTLSTSQIHSLTPPSPPDISVLNRRWSQHEPTNAWSIKWRKL